MGSHSAGRRYDQASQADHAVSSTSMTSSSQLVVAVGNSTSGSTIAEVASPRRKVLTPSRGASRNSTASSRVTIPSTMGSFR